MNAQLTEAGRAKLAEAAPGHVNAVRENLLDLLTPEQLGQLTAIGGRLLRHLGSK
jgi:DNA-binding MarR family transcriptional regulator